MWSEGDKKINQKVFRFTVGKDWLMDQILLPYDLKGSAAHAKMLAKIGILSQKECSAILQTLDEIKKKQEQGKIQLRIEDEDMHSFIENYLVSKLGEVGKKIHTGRSRNDQVLTALRLYYKESLSALEKNGKELLQGLKKFKSKYGSIEMAGYTHMRKAMPSSVGLWAEAFLESIEDSLSFLKFVKNHIDQNPLGTGAGYGVPLKLDRTFTTQELQFRKTQNNPIYVQNSRGKFESLLMTVLGQMMFDINKMASDLILFSMPEFGIFEIPEEFCTGSSIMPQKKNPDVLELLRGRYHLVIGEELKLKSLIGNLISGFHRDTQLTKEITINALAITLESVDIMALLAANLKVNRQKAKESLTKEVFATQRVYDFVQKGIPFRKAYHQVKKEISAR